MKEFFDHFLMGKPAPEWYTDGVPRLEMEDHLKERAGMGKKARRTLRRTRPRTRQGYEVRRLSSKKPGQ